MAPFGKTLGLPASVGDLAKATGDLGAQAGELGAHAIDLGGQAMEKLNEWLDQYKKGLDVLTKFGFSVSNFHITIGGMPSINASVDGSIAKIDLDALGKIIQDHAGDTLMIMMLNAIIIAKRISDRVELKYNSMTLDITISLTPACHISFH